GRFRLIGHEICLDRFNTGLRKDSTYIKRHPPLKPVKLTQYLGLVRSYINHPPSHWCVDSRQPYHLFIVLKVLAFFPIARSRRRAHDGTPPGSKDTIQPRKVPFQPVSQNLDTHGKLHPSLTPPRRKEVYSKAPVGPYLATKMSKAAPLAV